MTINGIDIEIERKPIKHLHLAVYPPDGRVHASVPEQYTDEQIRFFVLKKWVWLLSKRQETTSYTIQSERQYLSGEAHYLFGNLYRLKVIRCTSGNHQVTIKGDYICVYVYDNTKKEAIASLMTAWYKEKLTPVMEKSVRIWEERLGVKVSEWQILQMPSSWGKCHKATGKINFNVELAKKPLQCIEYIVVHELAHLLEQNHTDRFHSILSTYLPGWETIKQQLNEFPL